MEEKFLKIHAMNKNHKQQQQSVFREQGYLKNV